MENMLAVLATVLVVIDMQPGFAASLRVLDAVKAEVKRAISLNMPIIILEDHPALNQHTHADLTDLLKGYDTLRYIVVQKDGSGLGLGSGGGKEVTGSCELLGLPTTSFRLCGVKTGLCVFFTALELSRSFPDAHIDLVKEACFCGHNCCSSPDDEWERFANYAREERYNMRPYTLV
jgi:nicotinamidase-related amidase